MRCLYCATCGAPCGAGIGLWLVPSALLLWIAEYACALGAGAIPVHCGGGRPVCPSAHFALPCSVLPWQHVLVYYHICLSHCPIAAGWAHPCTASRNKCRRGHIFIIFFKDRPCGAVAGGCRALPPPDPLLRSRSLKDRQKPSAHIAGRYGDVLW